MKTVIDLKGNKIEVEEHIPVRTRDGIHYLHTPEEEATLAKKEAEYQVREEDYLNYRKYRDDRRAEYPPIEDQLDMIYHDLINGTTTFIDAIRAIKNKYAKPTQEV